MAGKAFCNYFTLKRPKGLTLSFEAILERVNTPFLLSIKRPPGVVEFKAEVSARRLGFKVSGSIRRTTFVMRCNEHAI